MSYDQKWYWEMILNDLENTLPIFIFLFVESLSSYFQKLFPTNYIH